VFKILFLKKKQYDSSFKQWQEGSQNVCTFLFSLNSMEGTYLDERFFLANKPMLYLVALGKANVKLPNNKY
jgi:hypothetical protein